MALRHLLQPPSPHPPFPQNWTRSDFNLASRVAKKAAGTASEDILIDAKSARVSLCWPRSEWRTAGLVGPNLISCDGLMQGWVTKLGAIKKSWKKRWFIFDVEAKVGWH